MGSTASRTRVVFRFGPFELSERDGELRKNGVRIKLGPGHGKGSEVARMTGTGQGVNWSLSPDGSLLAIVRLDEHEGRIRFMSLPSGVVREVVVKDWPRLHNVDWSADGKGLLMPSTTSNSTPVLLFVDREGRARVIWEGQKYSSVQCAIPSPDGSYLALMMYLGDSNVWMIENF